MKTTTLTIFTLLLFCVLGSVAIGQTNFTVTFKVDMSESEEFNPTTDEVYISGTFTDWEKPGDDPTYKMILGLDQNVYELTREVDSGEMIYKYFRVINGEASWDNDEWEGDPNRNIILTEESILYDTWGDKPVRVNFWIDLNEVEDFNPAIEFLYIAGSLANNWAMPGSIPQYKMSPFGEVDDYIYTHSLFLYQGDYEYKYFRIVNNEPSWDNGEELVSGNRTITVVDTTWMSVHDVWGVPYSGIFESITRADYVVYPNPTKGILNINELFDVNRIKIFDVTGKLVESIEINSINVTINTSDLKSGVYVVVFHTDDGVTTSQFVIR